MLVLATGANDPLLPFVRLPTMSALQRLLPIADATSTAVVGPTPVSEPDRQCPSRMPAPRLWHSSGARLNERFCTPRRAHLDP